MTQKIILVIAGIFIATAGQYYYYRDYHPNFMFADIIGKSAGGLFGEIIIPFIIAIIAKLFKKRFTSVFLTTLCIIGIPLFLFSSYGAYIEHNEEKKTAKKFVERTESQLNKIIESIKDESGLPKRKKAKSKAGPKK